MQMDILFEANTTEKALKETWKSDERIQSFRYIEFLPF